VIASCNALTVVQGPLLIVVDQHVSCWREPAKLQMQLGQWPANERPPHFFRPSAIRVLSQLRTCLESVPVTNLPTAGATVRTRTSWRHREGATHSDCVPDSSSPLLCRGPASVLNRCGDRM